MATSTKSSCRGELKWDILGQLSHLPVAFGGADHCPVATTVHPITSEDDGWKFNNKLGMKCFSEGPGGIRTLQLVHYGRSQCGFSLRSTGFQRRGACCVVQPARCVTWPCPVEELGAAGTCAALAISEHWGILNEEMWVVRHSARSRAFCKRLTETPALAALLSHYFVDNKSKILPVGCQGIKP